MFAGLSLFALLGACGSAEEDPKKSSQNEAIDNADCSDPKQNPYAQIECVTSFMGDCFMPAGMCMGVVSVAELGKTTLSWESGHKVEADPYYELNAGNLAEAGAQVSPKSSGADIQLYGATGSLCATGIQRMKQSAPDGRPCEVYTVYTNPMHQTLTYCLDAHGKETVTCSSNDVTYEVPGGKDASNCQSGSQAAGTCTVEVEPLDTSSPSGVQPAGP